MDENQDTQENLSGAFDEEQWRGEFNNWLDSIDFTQTEKENERIRQTDASAD